MSRFIVSVQKNWPMNSVELHLYERQHDGKISVIKGVQTENQDPAEAIDDVPFHLTMESAQSLMDDLWNAGIRPTDTRDRSETVKAMLNHIEDLRKVQTAFLDLAKTGNHQVSNPWGWNNQGYPVEGTVGDTKG